MPQSRRSVLKPSLTSSSTSTPTTQPNRKITTSRSNSSISKATEQPSPLQTYLLAAFTRAFPEVVGEGVEALKARIQRVKKALYARDFAAAFANGQLEDLAAYAVRWSPTRALGYVELFDAEDGLRDVMRRVFGDGRAQRGGRITNLEDTLEHEITRERLAQMGVSDPSDRSRSSTQEWSEDCQSESVIHDLRPKIVTIGGGPGAEIVALAGAMMQLQLRTRSTEDKAVESESTHMVRAEHARKIQIHVMDVAPWQPVLTALKSALLLATPPTSGGCEVQPIAPLSADAIHFTFKQIDVLHLGRAQLASEVEGAALVTLMFTLNELYTTDKARTTLLLLHLTDMLAPGAVLLVVDSAGSYGAVDIGGTVAKKGAEKAESGRAYPMHFLLDHTLLEVAGRAQRDDEGAGKRWRKVYEDNARWFRLPKRIDYPLDLENMRMQVHCYERL